MVFCFVLKGKLPYGFWLAPGILRKYQRALGTRLSFEITHTSSDIKKSVSSKDDACVTPTKATAVFLPPFWRFLEFLTINVGMLIKGLGRKRTT